MVTRFVVGQRMYHAPAAPVGRPWGDSRCRVSACAWNFMTEERQARSVLLAKRALPRSLDEPPPAVAEALAQLPLGFGQQSLGTPAISLNVKKLMSRLEA